MKSIPPVFASLCLALTSCAEQPPPPPNKPHLAVLRFENDTRSQDKVDIELPPGASRGLPFTSQKLERYGEIARSQLENIIAQWDEVRVLERERVDVIQQEIDFMRSRNGRRGRELAAARLQGATHIVYGQILDSWTEESKFEGYNIVNEIKNTSILLRVRVIEVSSDRIVFSAEKTGSHEIALTSFTRQSHSDPVAAAVKSAIQLFTEDDTFQGLFITNILKRSAMVALPLAASVRVNFDPSPKSVAVEIDGSYVGNSPLTRDLTAGVEHRIKLAKPGYKPWEAKVRAEAGLAITPELEIVSDNPKPVVKP